MTATDPAPAIRSGLVGTGALTRLALRRDRIALPAAVYAITAVVAGTAYTFKKLYPTRASVPGAWTALGVVVVIDLFGQVLQVSHCILDISPFTHAPRLPGGTVSAEPLLVLCLVALALAATGLAALRRRDIA